MMGSFAALVPAQSRKSGSGIFGPETCLLRGVAIDLIAAGLLLLLLMLLLVVGAGAVILAQSHAAVIVAQRHRWIVRLTGQRR